LHFTLIIKYSLRYRAVLDAKYREVIELEDIERLATYIIEFAMPVKGEALRSSNNTARH
jgi:hypothetical protein